MMMKCKQPEFTQEMKNKLNNLYKLLKTRFYTKQELMAEFGTGERQIRMMLSHLSHKVPLIATSGTNEGYKVATTKEDLELVEASWAELSSRIAQLEERIAPLAKFRDKFKFGIDAE